MAEIRRFDTLDWDAWGGSEEFANGKNPFIYEEKLNNGKVLLTMIGDANGISIMMVSQDDGTMLVWNFESHSNQIKIEGEMRAMIREFDLENDPYAPDLAYNLDHNTKWTFEYQEA